jgi:hypothetical protein
MTTQNLTDWFNLSEQKPWEPGAYEVDLGGGPDKDFSYWDGSDWGFISQSPLHAESRDEGYTNCTVLRWRGLSSDPNAKPAPEPKPKARGNRRVTRYVVMDPNYSLPTPVGTYGCKENAQERKQSIPGAYILKIRFRTPEAD